MNSVEEVKNLLDYLSSKGLEVRIPMVRVFVGRSDVEEAEPVDNTQMLEEIEMLASNAGYGIIESRSSFANNSLLVTIA